MPVTSNMPYQSAKMTKPTNAKPPAPYVMDMRFTALQHAPPPPVPTNLSRSSTWISEEQSEVRDSLSPIAWCLQNPPQEGEPGSGTVDLLVIDNFKVGDELNSQVFLVEAQSGLNEIEKGMKLVAKAYDPLYVDHAGEFNPFNVVDEHYSREVYSYKALSDLQGGTIPKFYGSYTLDIRIPGFFLEGIESQGLTTRQVRLILIEYIPGLSMEQANPDDFTQKTRKRMMKAIVEFKASTFERNVAHGDTFPRNVIIPKPEFSQQRLLVVVDFDRVGLRHLDKAYEGEQRKYLGKYIPPPVQEVIYERISENFGEWVDWDWKRWFVYQFADTEELITEDMWNAFRSASSLPARIAKRIYPAGKSQKRSRRKIR